MPVARAFHNFGVEGTRQQCQRRPHAHRTWSTVAVTVRENGAVSDQPSTAPDDQPARDRVTVRRAPRIGAFLVVGGFLGFLSTLIATSLFEADPGVGFAASLAYFSLYGVSGGVLIGALLAVAVDRRSRRRARTVEVEREAVAAEPEPIEPEPAEPESARGDDTATP